METDIELIPVKTLNEWFANIPLIYKLDLYNSFTGVITKHLVEDNSCENCREQDDCNIYQSWLNERDCCCFLRK